MAGFSKNTEAGSWEHLSRKMSSIPCLYDDVDNTRGDIITDFKALFNVMPRVCYGKTRTPMTAMMMTCNQGFPHMDTPGMRR